MSAGCTAAVFASAQEFLACPPSTGPCCLVLDVRMPGVSGLDLQKTLAGAVHRIPIIFVTGHGEISKRRRPDEHPRGAGDHRVRSASIGRVNWNVAPPPRAMARPMPGVPSSPSLHDGNMKQAGQPPLRTGPRLRAQLAEHL